MKPIYFIIPLVLTVVFGFYYGGWNKAHIAAEEAKEQARLEQLAAEEAEKMAYIQEQDKIARAEARKRAEEIQRKLDQKKEEEQKIRNLAEQIIEAAEKRDIAAAEASDARNATLDEKDLIERANERLKRLEDEKKFLNQYIPVANSNVTRMRSLLTEVERLEAQAAQAAAAAAAATQTKR